MMRKYAPVSKLLKILNVPKSSFYYKPRPRKSRKPKPFVQHVSGKLSPESYIIQKITSILSQDFTSNYGYIKITHLLKQEGFIINKKRVYRIMKEKGLLKPKIRSRARYKLPQASHFTMSAQKPFEKLQMDIKYVFIHSLRKNAFFLAIQDIFSRKILGFKVGFSMRKDEVISLIDSVILSLPLVPEKIILRTDRGPQFIANALQEHLSFIGISHELTRPYTPQQNAFIESFFSIFEREFLQKCAFHSLQHFQPLAQEFVNFYNQKRLHKGLNYLSPDMFLKNFFNNSKEVRVFNPFNSVQNLGG